MTKILGALLGTSFQTELLIMAFLGLANSTLDWKPFELFVRLNLISNLHIPINNVRLGNYFIPWVKRLLSITVIVEFFCSLLNPLAHLLKLYPIITWSRSKLLLPWLSIHALNTIPPKIFSISLAFIFYSENIISTMMLAEFLFVEMINLIIASYNWYVFFVFYMHLQEIDRKRNLVKNQDKFFKNFESTSRFYASIPNLQEVFEEMSTDSGEFENLRPTKSLGSLTEIESRNSVSVSGISIEENTLLTKKLCNMENVLQQTPTDMQSLHTSTSEQELSTSVATDIKKSNSSVNFQKVECTCPSSDDEEIGYCVLNQNIHTTQTSFNSNKDANILHSNTESLSNDSFKVQLKKTANRTTQTVENVNALPSSMFPCLKSASMIIDYKNCKSNFTHDNLLFLINKNFEVLDKIYCNKNLKKEILIKDNVEKWSIFRKEFESSLDRNVFLTRPRVKIEIMRIENGKQRNFDNFSPLIEHAFKMRKKYNGNVKLKSRDETSGAKKLFYLKDIPELYSVEGKNYFHSQPNKIVFQNKKLQAAEADKTEIHGYSNKNKILKASQSSCQSDKTVVISNSTCMKNSSQTFFNSSKYRKSNISVLKLKKLRRWPDYVESRRNKELENLKRYNDLTLKKDRQEMLQRKKTPKMASYNSVLREQNYTNSAMTNVSTTRSTEQSTNGKNLRCHGRLKKPDDATSEKMLDKTQWTNDFSELFSVYREMSELTQNIHRCTNDFATKDTFDDGAISLDKANQSSMRRVIKNLDWSVRLNTFDNSAASKNVKSHFVGKSKQQQQRQQTESEAINDEEALYLLRYAFSYSDENERGFRLGPESREAYPMFQVVALTMTEILKATGWRSFNGLLQNERESGIEIPDVTRDMIFCADTVDFDSHAAHPTHSNILSASGEIEQRRNASASILRQLQELLDSSRETLNDIENLQLRTIEASNSRSAETAGKSLPMCRNKAVNFE